MSNNPKKIKKLNEILSPEDIDKIRKIIRNEIAEVYFQLYRKRHAWS